MRIESVEFFYLSMPQVEDIGDGSQDALLVRVRSNTGLTGWGECEAAPLPSIAAWNCPMSHSACKPLSASVLGRSLEDPDDIRRINQAVRSNSYDLLQTAHTLSGVDIALWDLLGKQRGEPAYRLLGHRRAFPKRPYASMLFGDSPERTFEKARQARDERWTAVKFGWGPIGLGSPDADADHFDAAREGIGADNILCVDIGTVWNENLSRAAAALPALESARAHWLEEPFHTGALELYGLLADRSRHVPIAAGEGSHTPHMAYHLVEHGGVRFIQIDAGRIGGLTPAYDVARFAERKGITYVNHTFTSHLALAASLAPYAGLPEYELCEYPVELKPVAAAIGREQILPSPDGLIRMPDRPGIGVTVNEEACVPYLVDAEIRVGNRVVYRTPALVD